MKKWCKQCPYCGEEIRVIAKKCRFCWEFLDKGDFKSREIKDIIVDEYTKNLMKVITIKDEVFEQSKNQIFYRDNIPTKIWYYRWRILITIILLFIWIWPWLILLWILFFEIKPRNRFLLINDDVIWWYNKWYFVMWAWSNKNLINKRNVYKIEIDKSKNAICVNRMTKRYKRKSFYFNKIHNLDTLIKVLKNQWYKLEYK